MMNKDLVSIVVLTYNSEDFIIETLNSILGQNYELLELIVSDDGSKDETCDIVDRWIEDHKRRFVNAQLIRSFRNQGTCANYNQGICNSHGFYIKTLDGDDCLNGAGAISSFVKFMVQNNCSICISDVDLFSNNDLDLSNERKWYDYILKCESEPFDQQKKRISKELAIADPGVFFRKELFNEVGGIPSKYRLLEEWPFFYSVIMSGYQIYSVPKRLVRYRINDNSVSHNYNSPAFILLQKDLFRFFWLVRAKQLIKTGALNSFFREALQTTYTYGASVIRYFFHYKGV